MLMACPENCCPTCGAKLHDQFSWDLSTRTLVANGMAVRFPPIQGRIIDALWKYRHKGGITSTERFMYEVYGDDPDGGPESFGSISVQLTRLRKTLSEVGYTVTLNNGHPRLGFRLIPLVIEPPCDRDAGWK